MVGWIDFELISIHVCLVCHCSCPVHWSSASSSIQTITKKMFDDEISRDLPLLPSCHHLLKIKDSNLSKSELQQDPRLDSTHMLLQVIWKHLIKWWTVVQPHLAEDGQAILKSVLLLQNVQENWQKDLWVLVCRASMDERHECLITDHDHWPVARLDSLFRL